MLTWVSLAAALGAVVLVARWWFTPPDLLGRRKRFPSIAVPLLLVVAAATGWVVFSHHQLESRLSVVASDLVGKPVSVHCQSIGETFLDAGAEAGFVMFSADGVPERRTVLKRDICNDLRSYDRSTGVNPTLAQVSAVHVLTHESMHMAGTASEAVTECKAVQRDARTARLLGASDEAAAVLARTYWREQYPRMPADYQSGECAKGGTLDESLPDAPW